MLSIYITLTELTSGGHVFWSGRKKLTIIYLHVMNESTIAEYQNCPLRMFLVNVQFFYHQLLLD